MRPETLERDRETERDYEPVSLPKFLATLGVVARDAEQLPPAATAAILPTLRARLAEAQAPAPKTSAGVAVLTRPPAASARAALMGSTSAPPRPFAPKGPIMPRPPPRGPG